MYELSELVWGSQFINALLSIYLTYLCHWRIRLPFPAFDAYEDMEALITSVIFLESWKQANIIPIFKKGTKSVRLSISISVPGPCFLYSIRCAKA